MEDERGSLPRRQVLQRGDEGQFHALTLVVAGLGRNR
jgi:hypothetical protein